MSLLALLSAVSFYFFFKNKKIQRTAGIAPENYNNCLGSLFKRISSSKKAYLK
jgi:hypothetical protein